jgi:hypothetical protein
MLEKMEEAYRTKWRTKAYRESSCISHDISTSQIKAETKIKIAASGYLGISTLQMKVACRMKAETNIGLR